MHICTFWISQNVTFSSFYVDHILIHPFQYRIQYEITGYSEQKFENEISKGDIRERSVKKSIKKEKALS